jgi:cytochrome c oxidase subunit 3
MTQEPFSPAEERDRRIRTRKLVTWLIVFAIVMFFAGLTSAYVVSMSGGYWVRIAMPQAFIWSTVVIVASSLTAQLALVSMGRGRSGTVVPLLAVTLLLGGAFTWFQFQGWNELVSKGHYVVGKVLDSKGEYGVDYSIQRAGETLVLENGKFYMPGDAARAKPLNSDLEEQRNTASSYLYVLTAAHLAHLAFGLLSMLVMVLMAALGRYSAEEHPGLWSGVVYWHFLAGLWVYLLLFLTFVH